MDMPQLGLDWCPADGLAKAHNADGLAKAPLTNRGVSRSHVGSHWPAHGAAHALFLLTIFRLHFPSWDSCLQNLSVAPHVLTGHVMPRFEWAWQSALIFSMGGAWLVQGIFGAS